MSTSVQRDASCRRSWTRFSRHLAYTYGERPYQQLKALNEDPLAFRWYVLRREGWGTLRNVINGAHNLPNVY